MELQTPSGFPGNFWKRKVLWTLWFPSGVWVAVETLGQANLSSILFYFVVGDGRGAGGVNRPCP